MGFGPCLDVRVTEFGLGAILRAFAVVEKVDGVVPAAGIAQHFDVVPGRDHDGTVRKCCSRVASQQAVAPSGRRPETVNRLAADPRALVEDQKRRSRCQQSRDLLAGLFLRAGAVLQAVLVWSGALAELGDTP